MIFTTKAEYGVRLLVELGRQSNDSPVSLKAIAESELKAHIKGVAAVPIALLAGVRGFEIVR